MKKIFITLLIVFAVLVVSNYLVTLTVFGPEYRSERMDLTYVYYSPRTEMYHVSIFDNDKTPIDYIAKLDFPYAMWTAKYHIAFADGHDELVLAGSDLQHQIEALKTKKEKDPVKEQINDSGFPPAINIRWVTGTIDQY